MIQILREGGGVRSLTSSRVENSMVTVLETVLPDEATGGADGGGESNRHVETKFFHDVLRGEK